MRKLLCFLLLSSPLFAQFTQVQGTVVDPKGFPYANGTILPTLLISGSPRFTSSGFPYAPPTQSTGLSSSGSFVVNLADVTQLTPSGGTWKFHVCSASGTVQPGSPISSGPVCFDTVGLIISGSVQDISAVLDAAAAPLTNIPVTGGGGTVTSVATGTGLTGGPISTSGTISLVTPVASANGGTGQANSGMTTGQILAANSASTMAPLSGLSYNGANLSISGAGGSAQIGGPNVLGGPFILSANLQFATSSCNTSPGAPTISTSVNGPGFTFPTISTVALCESGAEIFRGFVGGGVNFGTNSVCYGASTSAGTDTCLNRAAAGSLRVGVGSGSLPAALVISGNGADSTLTGPVAGGGASPLVVSTPLTSGFVQSANSCRIFSNVSVPNTQTPVCTFAAVPFVAANLTLHCMFSVNLTSAGTSPSVFLVQDEGLGTVTNLAAVQYQVAPASIQAVSTIALNTVNTNNITPSPTGPGNETYLYMYDGALQLQPTTTTMHIDMQAVGTTVTTVLAGGECSLR